ncbi:MAG: DNA methyltransferase [Candidatus Uhrbacteria bacterium]|nr:DNA methyltransferase [Candidatus Uhrbacteria bacterium]
MQTFAILGSHHDLSLAEIKAVTGVTPTFQTDKVAIFDDIKVELTKLQARLGGTQKVGYILGSVPMSELTARSVDSDTANLLVATLLSSGQTERINFGISAYSTELPQDAHYKSAGLERSANALGLEIKKLLKNDGNSARLVTSKESTLSSVVISKNKLLERGAEFVLIQNGNEVMIAQTAAVQNFEDWSHRDFDRPARNAKRGMLPPKLARMMVNLSGVEPMGSTLLDPFCGSGTVLMEAALVGFSKLVGSDISERAVQDTVKNIRWLEKEGIVLPEIEYFAAPATELSSVEPNSVDAIVTEPFLGKPREGRESKTEVERTITELTDLYQKSFSKLGVLLKTGGVVVAIIPTHFVGRDEYKIPLDLIFPPKKFEYIFTPVLYRQKGQFLGRNIVGVRKK